MKWQNNFGITVGDPINGKISIIRNTDGKWKKLKKVPKMLEGEALFAASNSNIKIIDNTIWIATGGKKSRIFKSINKGDSWQVFDTPFTQGKNTFGIYSIDFFDKNNGIAIGGDYSDLNNMKNNKAITIDGGKTWKILSNDKIPNYKTV